MGTGTSNKGLHAAPNTIPFRQLLCSRGAQGWGKPLSLGAEGMDTALPSLGGSGEGRR